MIFRSTYQLIYMKGEREGESVIRVKFKKGQTPWGQI